MATATVVTVPVVTNPGKEVVPIKRDPRLRLQDSSVSAQSTKMFCGEVESLVAGFGLCRLVSLIAQARLPKRRTGAKGRTVVLQSLSLLQ